MIGEIMIEINNTKKVFHSIKKRLIIMNAIEEEGKIFLIIKVSLGKD